MKTCDLHTHSSFSDGTCSPEELVIQAKRKGIGASALTDHHTVKGIPSFLKAAQSAGVEAVPGIEISADYKNYEVHILGLFLPTKNLSAIENWMEDRRKKKQAQNKILAENLNKAGYSISYEEIRRRFPESEINRAHFGAILTEKGYTASTKEALQTILHEKTGFYTPPKKPGFQTILQTIVSFGGLAVLAHPLLNLPENLLADYLSEAKNLGAAAAETYYSLYSKEKENIISKLVNEAGLLESGGSDFHGEIKPEISLGTGKGTLQIPYPVYETLKNTAKNQKNGMEQNHFGLY